MSRWLTIVFGVLAIGGVFFLFRSMMPQDNRVIVAAQTVPQLDAPLRGSGAGRDGMQVRVSRSVAQMRPTFIVMSGTSYASRNMELKAQAAGAVTATPVEPGQVVKAGAVLCELDVAGRDAKLRETQATLQARELAYNQALDLFNKGWAAQARVANAKAALDAAKAANDLARLEYQRTRITAPFAGVFERRAADVGDYLSPGQTCGTVVVLDPIRVGGEAPEQSVAKVQVGAAVRWPLPDGAHANGSVFSIDRTPNARTGGYRFVFEIENADGRIPVGATAEVRVQVGQAEKHKATRGQVRPDGSGRIGVLYVDVGGVVQFAPADVSDQDADGWWIAGLPHEALLLEEGQPDAQPGVRVNVDYRDEPPPPPS